MPLPTLSFLIGLTILAYLSTFIVFAILRITTGISIQRVGYSGFRHVNFSPRPGIRVNIRGVGLSLHQPTFALPTWCSLVITELLITVDLRALGEGKKSSANGSVEKPRRSAQDDASAPLSKVDSDAEGHGQLWRKLTEVKERIKRLHSNIKWLRLIDLVATAATLSIEGVGSVRLERVMISVDTRSKTVDRSRLFEHHKTQPETKSPAEWKSLIRSVLFTPEGRDSTEILDYATLNIHGMLHNELQGLRDASIALKLGRLSVPYDNIEHARKCADLITGRYAQPQGRHQSADYISLKVPGGLQASDSADERIMQTVSDSRAFIASILRGIQEVQFAVSFFGLSSRMNVKGRSNRDVFFNLAMKEVSLDVLRLDSKSPAHRMYFATRDVAHQGMLTAIAISAGIDDGHEHPERMVYIPMITATVKTTLPSRTIHYSKDRDARERNTNMLYANFVCTSPSLDLDPKHLPLLRDMLQQHSQSRNSTQVIRPERHELISHLLPKAYIKLAVQEPVIRVSLPPMDKSAAAAAEGDYDLLISSVSTASIELESSHSTEGTIHYNLETQYRHTKHQLYYQTCTGDRHDLLQSNTVEFQVDARAIPDTSVVVTGRLDTFTILLVRPDICEGVRQIIKQLRNNVLAQHDIDERPRPSFLRTMPSWLSHFRLEGSDIGFELAGVDEQVSPDSRGFALQLESWSIEYKAHRDEEPDAFRRRRSISRAAPLKQCEADEATRSQSPRSRLDSAGDGRRLTVHLVNLEGFVMDSVETSESETFLSMPRFEVAFTTTTDKGLPLFHINSHARNFLLQYSLYTHFAMGVAAMVARRTFLRTDDDDKRKAHSSPPTRAQSLQAPTRLSNVEDVARNEVTTIDFKANLIQIKASMPADPPMMIQLYSLDAGRHRYGIPFVRCRLTRMYVRAPRTQTAWSRIVSLKVLRIDLRKLKRKVGKDYVSEQSIDIVMDTIRFAVPHSLVVHSIFDNITNVLKVTKQLGHHFATGTNDYVLTKEPEGPKHVPRITLRTQVFIFDVEDSPFEWKLNAIYRAGMLEQKQRLAREDAFSLKAKRLARCAQQGGRGSSRIRAQSAHLDDQSVSKTRGPNRGHGHGDKRSRSTQPASRRTPPDSPRSRRYAMRYDAEGQCGLSDSSQLSIEAARERLHRLNAQSWKSRINRVLSFQNQTMHEIRHLYWGSDELPEDTEQQEEILALNQRPGLLVWVISDLNIVVDKPSFPIDQYSHFLHDVGKGMPHDMKYGLLVPMNLNINIGETRIQLRDYPLALLHVPALSNGQSARLPSLSMKTDFVIAEEFRDIESQRHVNVEVIPVAKMSSGVGFAIDVRRTISPVKTYSNMKFEINTSNPTKITWGTSYQPAIQDTMQVIEGFTKPPIDASDRVGFWDKIRLSFHSRVHVAWKGDGDVHLVLKGSRDPYVVTGQGTGLVMVWRNDVQWNLAQHEDLRQFMTVDSGDYILAVPDFNSYARRAHDADDGDDASSTTTSGSAKKDAMFKKVVMKLSGNVRWLGGLVFERDRSDGTRTFEFKPHYDVVLKHPHFAKAPPGEEYDAYRGFRSNHIHMSVAITAPHDKDWSLQNVKPSNNYNAVHLTPRFFSHFFSWWSMFSGVMSLPIRQGPLWGAMEKKSKKFGRHVATFKYNLLLSPLFVSHVYKHKDAEDYQENAVSATGLKMKLDSFMLDLHQRREYFDIHGHEGAASKQTSALKINQAQLDFINADLRALSASITGTSVKDIEQASEETMASLHGQIPAVDMSKFEIPDNDFTWIDMDDFVELDWILPAESDPVTKILPLGYAPRFTYFRQTDHGGAIAGDPTRSSPFGEEPTHYCVMSAVKNDPRRVQVDLIEKRLAKLRDQRVINERAIGEQELKIVQNTDEEKAHIEKMKQSLHALRSYGEHVEKKYKYLHAMLDSLVHKLEHDDPAAVPDLETSEAFFEAHENIHKTITQNVTLEEAPLADYTSDFNNRFIVHNAQIKWNNPLRNIILRYIHQNSQRRGFVYYMSQRAIKFILDVIEEKRKTDSFRGPERQKSQATEFTALSPDGLDDEETIQDRIDELLRDGRAFVDADDQTAVDTQTRVKSDTQRDDIAVEYAPLNTYQFRLIAPQVQLQSEKNSNAAVLVTAKGMQLKVVQIMDKDRVSDDVSGLVQRRFTAAADSLQMFVTTTRSFTTEHLHMYSANRYGAKAGTYWPPWVPMEVMFEFQRTPFGFNRVVHQTSASFRYHKYNTLRLKYNEDVSGGEPKTAETADAAETRMDQVWIEFPQFRAICDSAQYYALYIIVMDLLLYNEPLEKTRSERLEKIMLASDFSDLSGAPEMVHMLQERIRQLEEIKTHFQINEKYLDRQGWKDRIAMDQDLASCEDELFFIMKAITTAQQRVEDRREQTERTGLLHLNMSAKEIAWHLIRDKEESLLEFQLKFASFDRTNNNDGSSHNCIEIGRINGFNLLPDAIYPEIIGPYIDEHRGYYDQRHGRMLRIHWLMLEAIAGIQVVDYFEIDLVPLKLQVERDVAKKLFEYIFPGVGGNAFEGGGFSPLIVKHMLPTQDEEDESVATGTDAAVPKVPGADPEAAPQDVDSISFEQRLQPTLHLSKRSKKTEAKGLGISNPGQHHISVFQHSERHRQASNMARAAASRTTLGPSSNLAPLTRSTSERSLATMTSVAGAGDSEKSKRFALHRQYSDEKKRDKDKDKEKDQSDDLTQMMNRASNYMTLAFVKIPSMVLCLSYKGQGKRNLEDVHNLVFRMPTLEYRNKTWSNLDLALQLKKDVIRALISHAGAIVGNKFSHHKPSKQQQSRLREIANMSSVMSPNASQPRLASETSSLLDTASGSTEPTGRPSTASARPSTLDRTVSYDSIQSSSSAANVHSPEEWAALSDSHAGRHANEHANGSVTPRRRPSSPRASPQPAEGDHRPRATSIQRRLSGFGARLKTEIGGATGENDAEEVKRKSKLLLGGQKLLRTLRDQ